MKSIIFGLAILLVELAIVGVVAWNKVTFFGLRASLKIRYTAALPTG